VERCVHLKASHCSGLPGSLDYRREPNLPAGNIFIDNFLIFTIRMDSSQWRRQRRIPKPELYITRMRLLDMLFSPLHKWREEYSQTSRLTFKKLLIYRLSQNNPLLKVSWHVQIGFQNVQVTTICQKEHPQKLLYLTKKRQIFVMQYIYWKFTR
jgi:hypothetical protein